MDDHALSGPHETVLAHAAMLYYRDGLTQAEIARRMGLSRGTVVAYLRHARETGIVDIRIGGRAFATSPLAREIAARFGLADVYIAPAETGLSEAALARRVAELGAASLHEALTPDARLGVDWGETMQRLAAAFPRSNIARLVVHQLFGATNAGARYGGEETAIEIARRCGAACRTLHAPAMVSDPALAAALRAEPVIAAQLEAFGRLTHVVFSVGGVTADTTLVSAGVVNAATLEAHVDAGAVAVVCGRFIDASGEPVVQGCGDRIVGIGMAALKAVPVRMLVASGSGKHAAIKAVLRGRHATHLVTDAPTGSVLLSKDLFP